MEKLKLPEVNFKNTTTLYEALNLRKSSREFSDRELTLEELSNLLWSANGFNREESGNHTSPSGMNIKDIDIYAICKQGIFIYDPIDHSLLKTIDGDYRKETGFQEFVQAAPLEIVLVSDIDKLSHIDTVYRERLGDIENIELHLLSAKHSYAAYNAGHISQNIYLYAASANMSAVTRLAYDRNHVNRIMGLRSEQYTTLIISVGFPKE